MYISPSATDGNMRPKLAIFRLALMVPPIECDLGYRFASRTLPNLNPNPKADPDPLAPEPIRQTRPKPYHFFRWYGSQCKCRTTFQAHEFTHHVSDSESQQTKLTNLLSIMPGAVASCTRIVCYGYGTYYPRRARSALGVDTVLTLDVCLYVCMYVC